MADTSSQKKGKTTLYEQEKDLNQKIEETIDALKSLRGREVFILFLDKANITADTVDHIFENLRSKYDTKPKRLDVILESSGGSIDAAYNISLLLRRYAPEELNIIIPRRAKSAATAIACAGDKIEMTPIAELGPVDPQITMFNPLEKRLEGFSPLDIDSTLRLIREEFKKGKTQLAQGLLERLQFPLTLGGIKKSLDVGVHYLDRLLSSRMFKGEPVKAKKIAAGLVHNYSTHSFCVDCSEAMSLGLKADILPEEEIDCVWKIRQLIRERNLYQKKRQEKELTEVLKKIPKDLLKQLLDSSGDQVL